MRAPDPRGDSLERYRLGPRFDQQRPCRFECSEAGFFGDEIVLMREGSIVQTGSIDDLLNRPVNDFVEQFIRAQRRPLEEHERGSGRA